MHRSQSSRFLPCSAQNGAGKSDSPSPKTEQVSKEKRERCWEHAVIYRMLCGLLHAGGGCPEVSSDGETPGPQFPCYKRRWQCQGEETLKSGRGEGRGVSWWSSPMRPGCDPNHCGLGFPRSDRGVYAESLGPLVSRNSHLLKKLPRSKTLVNLELRSSQFGHVLMAALFVQRTTTQCEL